MVHQVIVQPPEWPPVHCLVRFKKAAAELARACSPSVAMGHDPGDVGVQAAQPHRGQAIRVGHHS